MGVNSEFHRATFNLDVLPITCFITAVCYMAKPLVTAYESVTSITAVCHMVKPLVTVCEPVAS